MIHRDLHIKSNSLVGRTILLACTFLMFVACNKHDDDVHWEPVGSGQFMTNVMDIARTSSDTAMMYISAAEQEGGISWDTIHMARALVYEECNYDYDSWEQEYQTIIDSTKSSHGSDFYFKALNKLAEIQMIQGKSEAAATCLHGAELAERYGKLNVQAEFMLCAGMYSITSDRDKASDYIATSLQMYYDISDEHGDSTYVEKIMYNTVVYMTYFYVTQPRDAIKWGKRSLDFLHERCTPDVVEAYASSVFDVYLMLCQSYCNLGQYDEAGKMYDALQKYTEKGARESNVVECLKKMHRYDEAILAYRRIAAQLVAADDTVNFNYECSLRGQMECFEAKGETDSALVMANRIIQLRKAIYLKNNQEQYKKWETELRTYEKDYYIKASMAEANYMNIVVFAVGISLIAVLMVLVVLMRYNRMAKSKNRALVLKINEFLDLRKMEAEVEARICSCADGSIAAGETHNASVNDNDALTTEIVDMKSEYGVRLFVRELKARKLYRDPNFKRDTLLTELGINKRTFSHDFEVVMGHSVLRYISILRVECAAELIRDFPNYTIEGIAVDSGFASRASFYRQFSDYFGISPSVYRSQLQEMAEKEG